MAVKFGKAFGLNVTVLSTSASKKEEALTVLGADSFLVTKNEEELKVDFLPFNCTVPSFRTDGLSLFVRAGSSWFFGLHYRYSEC